MSLLKAVKKSTRKATRGSRKGKSSGGRFWTGLAVLLVGGAAVAGMGIANQPRTPPVPTRTPAPTATLSVTQQEATRHAATYYAIETSTAVVLYPTLTAYTRRANPPTSVPIVQQAAPVNSSSNSSTTNSSAAPASDNSCPGLSYTCGSLTCSQAYACLAAGNNSLDRDKDGVPCESVCNGG